MTPPGPFDSMQQWETFLAECEERQPGLGHAVRAFIEAEEDYAGDGCIR